MSSAYSAMCVSVLMPSCKSFMNRTKSKGPKMDPFRTIFQDFTMYTIGSTRFIRVNIGEMFMHSISIEINVKYLIV